MNPEIPKPENIEDGTDLYDGMIFEVVNNVNYLASLDSFTLNKLKDRLDEYYKIMDDADYTKGEKLTERLGCFIDKYKLKTALNRVSFLLIKEGNNLDDVDTAIITFMGDSEILGRIGYEDLIPLRNKLMWYYAVLEGGDDAEKEKLFERIGHYLAPDSVKGMLDYIESLIEEKEREMQG